MTMTTQLNDQNDNDQITSHLKTNKNNNDNFYIFWRNFWDFLAISFGLFETLWFYNRDVNFLDQHKYFIFWKNRGGVGWGRKSQKFRDFWVVTVASFFQLILIGKGVMGFYYMGI